MDPFVCYTFKEDINNLNAFTRIHTQEYSKLSDNIQRKDKLISKLKQESNRNPRHTDIIYDPTQRGKASLESVMLWKSW